MSSSSGGGPSMPRTSTKRSYSTMAAAHREESPDSLFVPVADDHYANERSSRRRRLDFNPSLPTRYTGDGLDFRRPIASAQPELARPAASEERDSTGVASVIDLTDEDPAPTNTVRDEELSFSDGRAHTQNWHEGNVTQVIDLSDDEGGRANDMNSREEDSLPGAGFLALPGTHQTRPRYSMLRRPARQNDSFTRGSTSNGTTPVVGGADMDSHELSASFAQPIDLTEDDDDDDDDDVIITESRPRETPAINLQPPETTAGTSTRAIPDIGSGFRLNNVLSLLHTGGERLRGRFMPELRTLGLPQTDQERVHVAPPSQPFAVHHASRNRHRHHHHHLTIQRPAPPHTASAASAIFGYMQNMIGSQMNYTTPAFDLGHQRNARPESPAYSPPPSPGPDFTRSPGEDEVVVCPNCGDELGVGEPEVKQEVWVIKSCGHAYCGLCARNRSRPTARKPRSKGKSRAGVEDESNSNNLENVNADGNLPPPFKKCVVLDCGKAAVSNSMIHVYLGS